MLFKMTKKIILIILFGLLLNGCATLHEAYQSTSDTVSSWFGVDETPDTKNPEKKPEALPPQNSETKTSDDIKIEEIKK
jgi:PBP1b-binding outer membrane lipoprotein LpoB